MEAKIGETVKVKVKVSEQNWRKKVGMGVEARTGRMLIKPKLAVDKKSYTP